jgi:type II secretion system protein N
MKNFLHWILSVLGYGAYTLAVVVALLWFLFPAESLREWLEAKLEDSNSSLAWEIGELRIAWPLSVVGLDIRAVKKGTSESLVLVDELKVRPDVTGIAGLPDEWPVVYRVRIFGGTVSGDASLDREQGTLQCAGEISNVQVGGMDGVWQQLGRKASGKLSGSFSYDGKWPGLLSGDLQADLALTDGSLEFQQPVFGLGSLEFNRLTTVLSLSDRIVTLENGKIDSDLFGVDFTGTVTMADNLLGSGLAIKGSFEPRPELLGSLKDPAVVQLIKGQLHEDKLTFSLSDTLLEPGMLFQGVSGAIDGIIQGSGR